jgi:nucleoside-diphosphate-sugar epimerase
MHLEKRILVTGGAGFLGSHLCEACWSAAPISCDWLPKDDGGRRRPGVPRPGLALKTTAGVTTVDGGNIAAALR